jgi:hypothetical protein
MLFNESPSNEGRRSGLVYNGFAHPITGKVHRLRKVTGAERTNNLFHIAMQYLGIYGLWATGGMKLLPAGDTTPSLSDIPLLPNDSAELRIKLSTAAAMVTKPECRVNHPFEIQKQISSSRYYPRVVLLSEGDQANIPEEYFDLFCFWLLSSASPEALTAAFENSFDAILNLTAMEARRSAKESGGTVTSRQVYEQILDQAFKDAELTLEPFVSRAPSPDHALAFKTVIYVILAREGLIADDILDVMESNTSVSPLDYFTAPDCKTFLTGATRDGYAQLIVEGLAIIIGQLWQNRQSKDFKAVQSRLDAIHFLEDIVIFFGRCRPVFQALLPD